MGECEAFYKVMPNFRLKDSNVATIMLPTGTKETRSKFMIQVDDDFDYGGREKKKISGRDGWFVEKYDLVDKYVRRDKNWVEGDEVCVIQYYKMFMAAYKDKRKGTEEDFIGGSDDENQEFNESDEMEDTIEGKFHYVMTATKGKPVALPPYVC